MKRNERKGCVSSTIQQNKHPLHKGMENDKELKKNDNPKRVLLKVDRFFYCLSWVQWVWPNNIQQPTVVYPCCSFKIRFAVHFFALTNLGGGRFCLDLCALCVLCCARSTHRQGGKCPKGHQLKEMKIDPGASWCQKSPDINVIFFLGGGLKINTHIDSWLPLNIFFCGWVVDFFIANNAIHAFRPSLLHSSALRMNLPVMVVQKFLVWKLSEAFTQGIWQHSIAKSYTRPSREILTRLENIGDFHNNFFSITSNKSHSFGLWILWLLRSCLLVRPSTTARASRCSEMASLAMGFSEKQSERLVFCGIENAYNYSHDLTMVLIKIAPASLEYKKHVLLLQNVKTHQSHHRPAIILTSKHPQLARIWTIHHS